CHASASSWHAGFPQIPWRLRRDSRRRLPPRQIEQLPHPWRVPCPAHWLCWSPAPSWTGLRSVRPRTEELEQTWNLLALALAGPPSTPAVCHECVTKESCGSQVCSRPVSSHQPVLFHLSSARPAIPHR